MQSVWYKAHTHTSAIEQYIRFELAATPASPLTVKQVHVLALLYAQDAQHPNDLAKGVGFAATSFTPVLDIMENMGFISRAPDPYDRRAIIISLTDKGRELEPVVTAALKSAEGQFGKVIK